MMSLQTISLVVKNKPMEKKQTSTMMEAGKLVLHRLKNLEYLFNTGAMAPPTNE